MIDKTITLTEPYPSDFKPTMSVMEIQKHFDAHGFHDARMIGGSKSFYRKEHPDDLIVFNANVLMPNYGKVWYGDLNLTQDYIILKSIADTLDTTLYVLWEMDGRFGLETKPLNELLDKAVWNTTEDKPTKEWKNLKYQIDSSSEHDSNRSEMEK
jgi:hypothetical protein